MICSYFDTSMDETASRAKPSSSYLCDVHHISHESKTFQLELRNVGLQQHVDLKHTRHTTFILVVCVNKSEM